MTKSPKRKSTKKKVPLKHAIAKSLFPIADRHETGKRLQHKQTSHGILLLMLLVVGCILFASLSAFKSFGIIQSGTVLITATVKGKVPTVGAVITSPQTQSKVRHPLLAIDGTCPAYIIVAVYNNGTFAGSTTCSSQGVFEVIAQLTSGINTIQAQDYDSLNQSGPTTSPIVVNYVPYTSSSTTSVKPNQTVTSTDTTINQSSDITTDKSITATSTTQPSNSCFDSSSQSSTTGSLSLGVTCVTRNVYVGQTIKLPVNISGGTQPYALSVDWGDSTGSKLYSFPAPGHYNLAYTYELPEVRSIHLNLADSTGSSYKIQTVVQVSEQAAGGQVVTTPDNQSSDLLSSITKTISDNWFEISIPVYWIAVSLVLGFWVGDIFQRRFGIKKRVRRHA